MKSKISFPVRFMLTALFLSSPVALATGGDAGNGGSLNETLIVSERAKLEETALKIIHFFETTPQVWQVFPEVNVADLTSLRNSVAYNVVESELRDREGQVRTCLNYIEENQKHVDCNLAGLRSRTNASDLFVLVFHELLGLQNVEVSSIENRDLMQSYPISSRLAQFVAQTANYSLVYTAPRSERPESRDFYVGVLGVSLRDYESVGTSWVPYREEERAYGTGSGLEVNSGKVVGISYARTRHRRSARNEAYSRSREQALARCQRETGRECEITSENSTCERRPSQGQVQYGGGARACRETNEFGEQQVFYGPSRCRRRERRERIADKFKLAYKFCWTYSVAEPK